MASLTLILKKQAVTSPFFGFFAGTAVCSTSSSEEEEEEAGAAGAQPSSLSIFVTSSISSESLGGR